MTNFTILDAIGSMQAALGFVTILLCPGYVLGTALDLFGFRNRSPLERLAWAVALSFALAPIVIEFAGRLLSLQVAVILFVLGAIAAALLVFRDRRNLRNPIDRNVLFLALFFVFGAALTIGELVDIQRGNRLYMSVTVLDQAYRVAFINAIAHTGIPPLNPLYLAGSAVPLRYYYFWYALCALCMKLVHVSARQALIASSVWVGIGLIAMISLFARHFLNVRAGLQRLILVASLLLAVTGLDILPVVWNLLINHEFSGDLEWWSTDQIASWFDSVLWVPNHVAALLCCLAAFLLLWRTREKVSGRDSAVATVLAGVATASAFGTSVYVAAGFLILMGGWAAGMLFGKHEMVLARRIASAIVMAAVLLIPYLRGLASSPSGTQQRAAAGPSHLFRISVRKMIDSELIAGLPVFARLKAAHPVLLDQTIRLALLLPGYALELGVFGLVLAIALWNRRRLSKPQRTALVLAGGGLCVVSFLRSSVIGNNDFGYRAALFPCFFLLLLTAQMLLSVQSKLERRAFALLLIIGLAGTAFQALMLRVYVPLHVATRTKGFVGLPEEAFAARTAYAVAARMIPVRAVVQASLNDDPVPYFSAIKMLYSERAMVTDAQVDCGAVFGGDPTYCVPSQQMVRALFLVPAPSAGEARERCRQLGIDFLASASSDPAWQDKEGWIWTLPPTIGATNITAYPHPEGSAEFKIVDCASPTLQSN